MTVNEIQHGGNHYKGTFQHWDVVADLQLNYYLANATKYITRHRKKNGREDVLKAQHYIDKLLELIDDNRMPVPFEPAILVQVAQQEILIRFLEANGVEHESPEWKIMHHLCMAYEHANLVVASTLLRMLVEEYDAAEPSRAYVDQGRDK
jgi:Protein of unknwon function (DUF3310)